MFSPQGPSLRELARQALSSVQDGYDLLAPTFDRTPFRTSAPGRPEDARPRCWLVLARKPGTPG